MTLNANIQIPSTKQVPIANNQKQFDLEDRTFAFAKNCRDFVNTIPRTIANNEYFKQLVRSSGSVAANYIEANEALSKKDFSMRIKICKKETKESRLWLQLLELPDKELVAHRITLQDESTQLIKIFAAIVEKAK